jgi:hypothetical protein
MLDKAITIVIGRLTNDVVIREFTNSHNNEKFHKAEFTIAVNDRWNTTDGQGNKKANEHTEYYRCYAKGGLVFGKDGTPGPIHLLKKGFYVVAQLVKRERSYDEHLSVEGIGPLYLPNKQPLTIKRWITEFMVEEINIQPKSWATAPANNPVYGQATPAAATPANTLVAGPSTGGAAPMPMQATPMDAAAAGFAASNGDAPNV